MNATQVNSKRSSYFQTVFGLDLRALALFRIGLGLILLVDLGMRSLVLEAMYTDDGAVPRSLLEGYARQISGGLDGFTWSLHAISGAFEWQVFLIAIAALAATSLLVGFQTRVAAAVSCLLLVSIYARNPLILHSGDSLLRVVVFFAIFLPLGAVWSVDARRNRASTRDGSSAPSLPLNYASGATAGIVFALFNLYFFAGVSKLNEFWFSGEAMEYVSRLDIYATSIGRRLREYSALMQFITWFTLVLEVIVPFLLFVPWKNALWRGLLFVVFVGFHLGIAINMNIGTFQYISIMVWLALLPTPFFDFVARKLAVFRRPEIALSETSNVSGSRNRLWTHGVAGFFVVYFLLWNIASIHEVPATRFAMPRPLNQLGRWMNMTQQFRMFDTPPPYSPWFVYDARLVDGSSVDLLREQPVSYDRPVSIKDSMPAFAWRRLHRNLSRSRPEYEPFRQTVADYLILRWNRNHGPDKQVVSMKATAFLDEITPHAEVPAGQIELAWAQHNPQQLKEDLFDDVLEQLKKTGEILP